MGPHRFVDGPRLFEQIHQSIPMALLGVALPSLATRARAGCQRRKSNAQESHWNRLVYLLKKPRPIHKPVRPHCHQRLSWMARQPASMAATQKSTDKGSIVMRAEPA